MSHLYLVFCYTYSQGQACQVHPLLVYGHQGRMGPWKSLICKLTILKIRRHFITITQMFPGKLIQNS